MSWVLNNMVPHNNTCGTIAVQCGAMQYLAVAGLAFLADHGDAGHHRVRVLAVGHDGRLLLHHYDAVGRPEHLDLDL